MAQMNIEELILKAEEDKSCLGWLYEHFPDEAALSGACFRIEQATEKFLKAYILMLGGEPQPSHNISKNREIAESLGGNIPPELEDIEDSLEIWASKSRYVTDYGRTTKKFKKASEVLYKLNEVVKEKIDKDYSQYSDIIRSPDGYIKLDETIEDEKETQLIALDEKQTETLTPTETDPTLNEESQSTIPDVDDDIDPGDNDDLDP